MAFTSFTTGTTLFYVANGTYTWTCPPGVTFVNVECWGAGGGGGGTESTSAAGGGGGAYAIKANIPVVPGTTYTVTVGLGAAGSTGSASGGGSSWFSTTGTVLAVGGNGGTALGVAGAGGAAGSCVGDLAFSGGSGLGSGGSAGGGGAAGTTANGTTATTVAGGAGGVFGGGAGGSGLSPSAGQIPGGGGGSSITLVGAAGADGQLNLNYVVAIVGSTTLVGSSYTDNSFGIIRKDRYRELVTTSRTVKQHSLADEVSYFIATNPTPGTGIAMTGAQTTLSDTKPFIAMTNPDSSNKRVYLAHFDLVATTAGTSTTASFRWAVKIDGPNRAATTGGSTIVPVNVTMASTAYCCAIVQAGALTTGAVTREVRLLGSGLFQIAGGSDIPIIGSAYNIVFGGKQNWLTSIAPGGASVSNITDNTGPVIIGPGQKAYIYLWFVAGTGTPAFEFELAWYER